MVCVDSAKGGVLEERVGQNCGFVVTVRAAVKRQLVLTNHVVYRRKIAESNTLVLIVEHQYILSNDREA
jgi:hypothetical protein